VPACDRDGAGMKRHVRTRHAGLPCNRAAESFVSFIPLFDSTLLIPRLQWAVLGSLSVRDAEVLAGLTNDLTVPHALRNKARITCP
jgi:hypothetical protein